MNVATTSVPPGARWQLKGLSHIAFYVADLEASICFYRQVLALDVFDDHRGDSTRPRVTGLVAGAAIELIQVGSDRVKQNAGVDGGCMIAFAVDDMDEAYAALRASAIEVTEPQAVGRARYLHFRDPDGRLLELVELPRKAASMAELATRIRMKA